LLADYLTGEALLYFDNPFPFFTRENRRPEVLLGNIKEIKELQRMPLKLRDISYVFI
jgi:hypothetical protein